jgi:uncharacterized protein YdbL (DUF1318 family)
MSGRNPSFKRASATTDPLRRRLLAVCLALPLAIAFGTGDARAQGRPLDAPRAAGVVGERFDGFAVVRASSASPAIRRLVDDVNAQRRAYYAQQAKSRGASAAAVGRVYAREIINAAPPGTWFQQESGGWARK